MENKLAAMNLEERKEVKYGDKPLADKKARNTDGTPVTIETNLRRLTLKPNTPIYKYAVSVLYIYKRADGVEVVKEMSKDESRGAEHENCKNRCQKVYKMAIRKFPELGKGGPFFYDRQAELYSLSQLNGPVSFTITEGVSQRANFVRAEFKIVKVAESFQSTSNEVSRSFNSVPNRVDHTLHEALNLIISGPAFENPNVVTIGNCQHYLYSHDPRHTGIRQLHFDQGDRDLALGAVKSVKTLQGGPSGDKDASLFLTTELRTTLFHPDNKSLLELLQTYPKFRANLHANSIEASQMRTATTGLQVWLDYGESQGDPEEAKVVVIQGFGLSAREHTFEVDGIFTTVASYFQNKYKITLKFPNLFTIEAKGKGGRKMLIPAECLRICANQTVKNNQMISKEQQEMIKISAAKPNERKNATNLVAQEVGIASNSIQGFISVGEPEKVTGIILPKPEIEFGEKKKVNWIDSNKRGPATDFKAVGKFVLPAPTLVSWQVVFVAGEALNEPVNLICKEMEASGMRANKPGIVFIDGGKLEKVFLEAKNQNINFLFFVTKEHYNYHQEIKALEQEYDILTQDVLFETAEKLFRQPQTKKNIVQKINIKTGGLNYIVNSRHLQSRKRLIVGFETSKQGGNGGHDLISVGFAANIMKHTQQYCGGYIFVKKHSDVYGSVIEPTLSQMIMTCADRRELPDEIFVYITGITEANYGRVNEAYQEAIKNACRGLKTPQAYRPHIHIMVATKTHNERMYMSGESGVSNLEPGTVVDHTVVSPTYTEFYLTSAVARQGTGKATKYTLISTTRQTLTIKELEELTYDLCYEHQIITQPISLPVPLYIAGNCALRGSSNLSIRHPTIKNNVIDLETTNARLTYSKNKKLFGTRFNA